MARYVNIERLRLRRKSEILGVNIIRCNNRKIKPKLDEEVGIHIAEKGILLECSKRLAVGTNLRLKIMLTFGYEFEVIKAPAKVIWLRKSFRNTYYLGCKFTKLKPAMKNAIKKFIDGIIQY